MVRGLGSTLHGDPRRLVEHQEIVVLVKRDGGEKRALGLGQRLRRRRRRRRCGRQWWNANALSGGKARTRLGASAIDAYLAGAEQLLKPAVRQVGVMASEPAVEAHAVLARLYCPRFDRRSLRHRTSGKGRLRPTATALAPCEFRVTLPPT